MLKIRARRSGFTLPEVLVTVAIVAVLAAAVVPTVVNQMSKGDAGAVVAEIGAFQTAVTQFVADTRKFPDSLVALNVKPVGTFDDLLGVDYGTAAVNRWRGPYVATTQSLAAGYLLAAFNVKIQDTLVAPEAGNGFHISLQFVPASGSFTTAGLAALDQLIDGGDGVSDVDCAAPSASSTGGRLRWVEAADTPCAITAVTYRLVPVGQQ